eukprot:scaffold15511_cov51-Phaeocystis_antarctica.AAC.1
MPLPMPSPSCAFVWSGPGLGVRRREARLGRHDRLGAVITLLELRLDEARLIAPAELEVEIVEAVEIVVVVGAEAQFDVEDLRCSK